MSTEGPPVMHPLAPAHEQMLLADLRRLSGGVDGRVMAVVRLSDMAPASRREARLRDISASFVEAVSEGAKLYWMRTWDLMVVYDAPAAAAVEASLVRLRFALGDDPLAEARNLVTLRPFAEAYETLIKEAEDRVIDAAMELAPAVPAIGGRGAQPDDGRPDAVRFRTGTRVARGDPLTPEMLGRIEAMLVNANLSSHVRRQSICVMVQEGRPNPMFTELFVSISDLRETLLPTVDLASNPWLFQRMTQTLDRRVLALLTHRDDGTLAQGFSINLNVASILSDEFLAFDDSVAPGAHGSVVIELRPEDVFADLGAYTFARDFVRQRGYRVCLDGLTWRSLLYVDARRLGAEMVKVSWTPDLPALLDGPKGPALRKAMESVPPGKLILARCDTQEAVAFGHDMGITLYQGRIIDTWLRGGAVAS